MTKKQILFLIILIIMVGTTIYFAISSRSKEEIKVPELEEKQEVGVIKEKEDYFLGGSSADLTIYSYGGINDIKTLEEGGVEYALIRNPQVTEGLALAMTDPFGNYYFAEDNNGNRIIFNEGNPEGKYGLNDVGKVSGKLISSRNTDTEFFASYPDLITARSTGLVPVPDNETSNEFLQNRYLLIKNLSNNVSVIAEIDNRGGNSDSFFVSNLTRKSLGLDNGAIGSFEIKLIPKEGSKLGIVRPI